MSTPSSVNFVQFFDSLELARIALIQSSAWRSKVVKLPASVHMEHEVSIQQGEPGSWTATCKYDFQAIPEQGSEAQLKISVTYSVLYTAEGELDDAMRGVMADNATLATWPYVRHLVRSATADMGLTPLDIGLYKVKFKANNLGDSAEKTPSAQPKKSTSKKKRSSG